MNGEKAPETTFQGASAEVEVELRRVVDRLDSLPLDRLTRDDGLGGRCHAVAVALADATADEHPPVPVLGPSGWGAQLAVLGRDYLASDPDDVADVLNELVSLRRSLP